MLMIKKEKSQEVKLFIMIVKTYKLKMQAIKENFNADMWSLD